MTTRNLRTPDLFDWAVEAPVARFDEGTVRAATLRGRIAKAIATVLRDSPLSRAEIAQRASDWLGERLSPAMLDAYASAARADHSISAVRLAAIVHATGDTRPLQLLAELFGFAVVHERYLPWIEIGQLSEHRREIDRRVDAAKRAATRGAR